MPSFAWWDYNVWHFLRDCVIFFLFFWIVSYLILRLSRLNRVLYSVIHPIVTYIFGSLIVGIFLFIGWIAPSNILKNQPPILFSGGLVAGWVVGLLVVARIYLIDKQNRHYRGWIYLLAIIVGILCYLAELRRASRFIPDIIAQLLPVPLMYVGYLLIKVRIGHLKKKKIKLWREQGLK